MDKSFIEKAITEKANIRFNNDLKTLVDAIKNSRILSKLHIKIGDNDIRLLNQHGITGNVLFNGSQPCDVTKYTNFAEIKKEFLEQYEKEETQNIIDKLDNISYLFNQ